MKVLFNGDIMDRSSLHVDLDDRGFQFGDGVYEVVRIYNGRFFTFSEHLTRLLRSMRELRIVPPVSTEILSEKANELLSLEGIKEGILYIQVTRGTASRVHYFPESISTNLFAYSIPFPRPVKTIYEGASAILVADLRWLRCDIKSINLLGNVLAKQSAREAGVLEAILHRDSIVTEGSSTNVLIVKENTIYTHPANNLILNGITKQVIFKIANEIGIPVIEKPYSIEELFTADEVMITSTTSEVTPILFVDGNQIGDGKPGQITNKLQLAFERLIE